MRMYEKVINGSRDMGGFPDETRLGVMSVTMPTLAKQARTMRWRDQLPPGHNAPTGVLDWID